MQCTGPTTCTAHCELFRSLAAQSSKHVTMRYEDLSKKPDQQTHLFGVLTHERRNGKKLTLRNSIFKKISTYPTYNSNRNLKRRTTWECIYLLTLDVFGLQPSNIKSSCRHWHPIDPEMWGEWPHGIEFRWDTKSPNFLLAFQTFHGFTQQGSGFRWGQRSTDGWLCDDIFGVLWDTVRGVCVYLKVKWPSDISLDMLILVLGTDILRNKRF